MADTKHTPGPWELEECYRSPAANGGYYTAYLVGKSREGKSTNVADVCESSNLSAEEIAANGLLLRAAPDLLDAMQEITSFLNDAFVKTPGSGERFDALNRFRAAIAKATGAA